VELAEKIRGQLTAFSLEDSELEHLTDEDTRLQDKYKKVAAKISKERNKTAKSLETSVNQQLKKLGMQHAQFFVALTPLEYQKPSPSGLEMIEFLVSTNPGQSPGPLNKIASGGELSRISLAIQVSTAQTTQTPSLVFDEVDVGIGGGIAKVVGELLRRLGEHSQILCVTHQAQVAGQCHNHFFVEKIDSGDGTNQVVTQIRQLKEPGRIEEIARMLGGDESSKESLAHAKTLFASQKK
jgi:DNA repair protein RecN (Recombination protein N)